MFDKSVYVRRRKTLVAKMAESAAEGKRGIALFVGNAEAPAQYKDNCYKFRQDSTWLYFFGIDEPLFAAVIDLDNGDEEIFADDVEIGDIIWMGPQPSVASKAALAGVEKSSPYGALDNVVSKALAAGRPVHFVTPSRYYNTMKIASLLKCNDAEVAGKFSLALTKAIISMRLVKEDCEIEQLDDASALGHEMHTVARNNIVLGRVEQEIVGRMEAVTLAKGWGVSFPTILTQHGETLHNHLHDKVIESGRLMVIDAGAENNMHYASDFTRTYPVNGKFTTKQRDIYQIVCDCNELAFKLTRPGITYREVHLKTMHLMLEELRALDIVRGNLNNMVEAGVAGLFMPHGLGHGMGLDVHDCEAIGERSFDFSEIAEQAAKSGTCIQRSTWRIEPGTVMTDEPGIYFIPALIDKCRAEGKYKGIVDYEALDAYRDFGGIRIEDDILVTESGSRIIGDRKIPVTVEELEGLKSLF